MAPNLTRYPPTPIRVDTLRDFTGGLNLRADAFQLEPNESPDMLDVSVEIGGGFVQRRVVSPYAATLPAVPLNVWAFQTPAVQQVVAATASSLYSTTGSTWTAYGPAIPTLPATVKPRSTVFNYNLYTVFGSALAPVRWTGSAATNLTQTWNETIGGEGAADGNMPFARFVCSHMGRLFIAYTTESGTDHPNRIRWSHAGFPEDWRAEDFIDIDIGRDGDVITGICEFRDRLYIFKNNSISALVGYGTQNFQVVTVSQDIGSVSQEAICVTEVGLFFFSWPQGAYLDRGTGPYPIFDKLWPLIRDGNIPSAYRHQIAMGWVNKNLWMSVPTGTNTVNSQTYVYNPWIWKNRYLRFLQGPWYPHTCAVAAFATVEQPTGSTLYLAANSVKTYVGQLEQAGSVDNWGDGNANIASYFRTNWVDIGQEAVIKRWRHPDVVMRPDGGAPVLVEVRRDYDPSTIYKTFQIQPVVAGLGMLWDDGSSTHGIWDDGTGTVGGKWSNLPVNAEAVAKGRSMGSARAVQMSFFAPTGQTWGVDAITLKFVPKRIRG